MSDIGAIGEGSGLGTLGQVGGDFEDVGELLEKLKEDDIGGPLAQGSFKEACTMANHDTGVPSDTVTIDGLSLDPKRRDEEKMIPPPPPPHDCSDIGNHTQSSSGGGSVNIET